MNKKHFLLLLSLFPLLLFAQEIKIQGILKDSLTKEAIPYANIIIKNHKDSIVKGTLTAPTGEFKIKIDFQEKIILVASCIGYRNTEVVINTSEIDKIIKLEDLTISKASYNLDEANVTAQNFVTQKFDRKVFNMNESRKASAKDILDLLRALPGVTVDDQANIRYKGAMAEIYVDDMPSQYLYPSIEMIPVANVDKIELIDASMRSGGSGKGGIINIKMKTATSDGLSGMANSQFATKDFNKMDFYTGFLNLNYKVKKVVFFGNIWDNNSQNYTRNRFNGSLTYNNIVYPFYEYQDIESKFTNLTYYAGAIINITPKTVLTVAGGAFKQNWESSDFLYHIQSNNGSTSDEFDRLENKNYINYSGGGYVHFKHTFDSTARELSGHIYALPAEIDHSSSNHNLYNFYFQNGQQTNTHIDQETEFDQQRMAIMTGLYYNHPVNEKARWNLNYNGNYTDVFSMKNRVYLNNIEDYQNNTDQKGLMWNNNLSWRIGSMWKKWKLDAGINLTHQQYDFEITRYNVSNQDTILNIDKNYINFLPSSTISYSLDSLQELKLTFARTASAPGYDNLAEYVDKQNPLVWYSGNTDLKTENFNNVYLGYSYTKPVFNLTTEIFYSHTNNKVDWLKIPASELVFLFMPENIAYESRLGVDLSSFASIGGKYNFNLSSSIFHTYYDATTFKDNIVEMGLPVNDLIKRNYGYNAKFYTSANFGKFTTIAFFFNYLSKEIHFKGYNNARIFSNINISRKFFKRRLVVSVGIYHLLNDLLEMGNYTNSLGFEQTYVEYDSTNRSRLLFVMLRYTFRQGDRQTGNIGK